MSAAEMLELAERLEAMADRFKRHQRGTLAGMVAAHMEALTAEEADLRAAARIVRAMARVEQASGRDGWCKWAFYPAYGVITCPSRSGGHDTALGAIEKAGKP